MPRHSSQHIQTGVRRSAAGPLPAEAELARLWAAQQFPDGPLATTDGTPVRVMYPGRSGAPAGPDFQDAVVQFGDEPPRVGDVELHREAADFARHGHAADPAYDRIVLHVVFAAADAGHTSLPSGRRAPVLVAPAPGMDVRQMPLREPCATAPGGLGSESVRAVLHSAGLWRLRRKTEALAEAIERDGPAQSLYAALAVALGQTANARAFRLLAERAPLAHVMAGVERYPEPEAVALVERRLLHAAGLDGALLAPAPVLPWVTHGLRPAAAPGRRIGGLARLLVRLCRPDLPAGARALVTDALAGRPRLLLDRLTVQGRSGAALCGRARAVELAVNALLLWAAACATLGGDDELAQRTLALAGDLPMGEPYGNVAHLRRNLRDARGRPLIRSALLQQGALAMLNEWCRRGGCGRCPLS